MYSNFPIGSGLFNLHRKKQNRKTNTILLTVVINFKCDLEYSVLYALKLLIWLVQNIPN